VASKVIRGDLPAAAGLADVWLELRQTLSTLADPARARRVRIAVKPSGNLESAEPAEQSEPEGPGEETEPGAATG
jgi:hypothetical protein